MKKIELLNVWPLIRDGKFGKISGDGKIKFVKILAKLSPVMKDYESYRETSVNKLKEEYPDFDADMAKAQAYERYYNDKNGEAAEPEMTAKEYQEFVKKMVELNKAIEEVLKEEADKEVDVTFDKLTATEFGCFCDSNDFTGDQALQLMNIICEL